MKYTICLVLIATMSQTVAQASPRVTKRTVEGTIAYEFITSCKSKYHKIERSSDGMTIRGNWWYHTDDPYERTWQGPSKAELCKMIKQKITEKGYPKKAAREIRGWGTGFTCHIIEIYVRRRSRGSDWNIVPREIHSTGCPEPYPQ